MLREQLHGRAFEPCEHFTESERAMMRELVRRCIERNARVAESLERTIGAPISAEWRGSLLIEGVVNSAQAVALLVAEDRQRQQRAAKAGKRSGAVRGEDAAELRAEVVQEAARIIADAPGISTKAILDRLIAAAIIKPERGKESARRAVQAIRKRPSVG
jgi:hypothetical protein